MPEMKTDLVERYQALKLSRRGPLLIITLDNPPTNAVTDAMHKELATVFDDANRDAQTKVVVLTGAGERAFSAGGDIATMQAQIDNPRGMLISMTETRATIGAMLRMEKPTIARINGHAVGLGATLALFCDLTYAVDTAKIGDPHVSVGFVAGDGGALIWPNLVGFARAREYLLTGDLMLAPEAARIGLINKAVPRDKLDEAAFGMAERLAKGPSQAINGTKVAINLLLRRQFEGLIEAHTGLELASNFSADHKEAVTAFLEKRQPKFTGE